MTAKKLIPLLFAALTLMLVSCESKNIDTETASASLIQEQPDILTNVFRGEKIPLPDGYNILKSVTPSLKSNGELRMVCYTVSKITAEDGTYTSENVYHAITLDSEYNVISDIIMPINSFSDGSFYEDSFIYVYSVRDFETDIKPFYIGIYDFTDGSNTVSNDITEHFSSPDAGYRYFYIDDLEVDSEGRIYLYGDNELIAFDRNFNRSLTFTSSSWIMDVAVDKDGMIYVSGNLGYGGGLYPIDPKTAAIGKRISVGNITLIDETFFGEGSDFYYYADEALWEYETESGTYKEVMSFTNSNISENDINILRVLDSETLLAAEKDAEADVTALMLYKKVPDIDISDIPTVEIATADGLEESTSPYIVEYNKNHTDVRIVVKDYSVYNSKEDPEGGMKKLATDILTGLYTPDIVEGDHASTLMRQIVNEKAYTDLYTFIDKDDYITRDDLFGCIKRFYDDDGKMWGITESFYAQTLIGHPDTLNGMTSWTLEEMLDFAMDLPEDKEFMPGFSKEKYSIQWLFPEGTKYNAFVDLNNNTASFDSPLFIKFLEFYSSIPDIYVYDPSKPYDALRLEGHYAVSYKTAHSTLSWMGWEAVYNSEDYVVIGYPTKNEGDKGSLLFPSSTFVILGSTDTPELTWDVLKSIIAPKYSDKNGYYMINQPILKSIYDEAAQFDMTLEYELSLSSGGSSAHSYDPDNPTDPASLDEPARISYFTEEKAARFKDFLDNSVGSPYIDTLPDDLNAIIEEEVGAYLSGRNTAEDCAKIVQSRVSIWLAEHE